MPRGLCRFELSPTRRRRSPTEPEIWAAHIAVVEGETVGETEIETDRARFLGRGRDARSPIAVMDGRPLSNTVGTALDPVFALRRRVRVQPGEMVRIGFWTVVASSPPVCSTSSTSITTPCLACRHIGVDPGARAAGSS